MTVAGSSFKALLRVVSFALVTLTWTPSEASGGLLSQVVTGENDARQQHIMVEGRGLVFPVLSPYCVLDRSREWDRIALEAMSRSLEPANALLAYWINCRDYERLRAGEDVAVGRYALILGAYGADGNLHRRGVTREAVVKAVVKDMTSKDFGERIRRRVAAQLDSKEFDALIGEEVAAAARGSDLLALERAEFEALVKQIGESGSINVFPLGRDESAAYVGLAIPDGRTKRAGVAATTLINGITLTFNVYDVPVSEATYASLKRTAGIMAKAAINVTDYLQGSARSGPQTWLSSIELPGYVRSGIIGAIAGLIIGVISRFVRSWF